jgi:hypothetical protein
MLGGNLYAGELLERAAIPETGDTHMFRTVKVYKFRMYDIANEEFVISRRMATYACIRRINAQPIKGTEI